METVSAADRRQQLGSRAAAWLPWILGDAFILFFLIRDLWLTHGMVIDRLDVWGRDFVNVWPGVHLIPQVSFSTLADVPAYQAFQHRLFGQLGQHNYSYPPVTCPVA